MASNYTNSLYQDFERVSLKLDQVLTELSETRKEHQKEMKELQKENRKFINELNQTIKDLQKIIIEKEKIIEKQQEEIDRLKNQKNKNSSNSSKSSSTDTKNSQKKKSANEYSLREVSGKSIGGQIGHVGSNLSKEQVEKMIQDETLKVITVHHKIHGNSKTEPTVKYRIGIRVMEYVEKHIFEYDEKSTETLPKEFYTDVTYSNDIKALCVDLNCYNVVAFDRLSEFFEVITQGVLKISTGTLVNFVKEFSRKSQTTLLNIEEDLLNKTHMNTDETTSKYKKKKLIIRGYGNEENILYKVHTKKGDAPIKEDNILPRYHGSLIHDHDTTLYKYGSKNCECNVHLGRYLEEIIQNEPTLVWVVDLKRALFRMERTRKLARAYGLKKFSKEEIEEYHKEVEEILESAFEANQQISSRFYRDKANVLLRRLKKYKKNHLYFLEDFDVPFDNNLLERDLRIFKTKTKIIGGFRSIEGAQDFANALSVIKTSKKRGMNPFKSILAIFNNQVLFE